jgi:hypothetical protein
MNYQEQYNKLITTRKNLLRKKGEGIYYESHHIIPKWLGGSDNKDNRILLTAKEHFIAHFLLWKHYRDRQSALAFHKMAKSSNNKQERKFTSVQFEKAKIAFIETQTGDKNWSRINGSPNKGKVNINKGKKLSKREWMTGENNPSKNPVVGLKISTALSGVKKSPEHLQKLNDIFFSKPKLQCHHCNKHVDYRNFSRWHGDNCIKIKERIK